MDEIKKEKIEAKLRDIMALNKLNSIDKSMPKTKESSNVIRRRKGCPDKWVA